MKKLFIPVIAVAILLTGCSPFKDSAQEEESKVVESNEKQLLTAQPAPTGAWSQIRQNIIDIEQAQITTTATTTFMFHMGNPNPVKICSSIGFPIPATYQLTNPQKIVDRSNSDDVVIAQQETTGVHTGDTSGTYVICIGDDGAGRIAYWEGPVETETGQAKWNPDTELIESIGTSTAVVSTEK